MTRASAHASRARSSSRANHPPATLARALGLSGGKHVVVIGSGATAVTLIPAMADEVASITMLQRTPSYIVNQPANDSVAAFLRRFCRRKPPTH